MLTKKCKERSERCNDFDNEVLLNHHKALLLQGYFREVKGRLSKFKEQQYLKENAQTKVTREAKAKFRNPFDRLDAGQSRLKIGC